jgi:putative transposase
MPGYRRLFVPGACYFFTVNLADRRSHRLIREIAALRSAVASTRARHAFVIDAWVVLPDHLHAVWTLPEGDCDFSTRWASIKRLFSWQLPPGEARSRSRVAKRERGIWQRRYWEHMIRDEADFRTHVDYVHFNPVKHGWSSILACGLTPRFTAPSLAAMFPQRGASTPVPRPISASGPSIHRPAPTDPSTRDPWHVARSP